MCYPKPGPRCSASAAARLARAKHAAYSYFMSSKDSGSKDWDELDALSKARDEAQQEYNITPAGIKALERQLAASPGSAHVQQKLEDAKAERASRLRAIKAVDEGDGSAEEGHQGQPAAPGSIRYANSKLSGENAVLRPSAPNSADVEALLDESEAWVNKLSSDEIEALHWYSMGGYADINGTLSRDDWGGEKADERVIALLDSALAKTDADKQVVVYRRHFFYNDAEDSPENENEESLWANLTFEEQAAQFPVGSVYKPGFFMSTSLNPSNIGMPMRKEEKSFMVRLEILTRRGAAMPAVSNGATSEQEILLPRDAAYRVVNNDQRISIGRKGEVNQVRVIQLEELA